ncbi:hypothetical protein NC653_017825 [Populus alba x Populus x berolinensis]|uniref:Uncharacterized protein n=1 Tax=Populus alba x Populus x berolinensis TaxID=444605 RepID=A0AAD6QRI5_9ROSI|nr:hypothetical protein NC653_017825 [Populus alba x Populus x berolinensis]
MNFYINHHSCSQFIKPVLNSQSTSHRSLRIKTMMNMCKKSLFLRAKATILLFLILPASANLVVAIRASSFVMTMMTEIEACSTEVTQISNLPIQPSSPSPHPCSNQPGDGQCKPPK